MNKSFKLIRAPDIETRIVIIVAAMNSVGNFSDLKNGVSFRVLKIMAKNITKIAKKTRASLTDILVETFFKFNPKKGPMMACQVSEIMIVLFQGFIEGFGSFEVGRWKLVGVVSWVLASASAVGRINIAKSISAAIPLFIFWLVVLDLNNLAMFKSYGGM